MLISPGVRIVLNTTGLISSDCIAFHNPFNGTLAVHNILIGFGRNARESDRGIVMNPALIPFRYKPHLLHPEVPRFSARDLNADAALQQSGIKCAYV